MTSPASSSIVVVDKSGSIDATNLIQSTQHVHQSQHQPIRAQQVIVSDEYLSNLNLASPLNIANIAIPSNSHPNSKVHVISNVTLTKPDQSQSQTINFVNSKHIQTSSGAILNRGTVTAGNYVIGRDTTKLQQLSNISTKSSQLQTKMVNIPFKTSTITQMESQAHLAAAQPSQQTQQQQQHIITKHLNNASAIVQKVIPRNILVSTGRIQNKQPATLTRTTAPAQHQTTNQLGSVIQIQKSNAIAIGKTSLNVNNVKSTKLNQQAIKLVNQTIGASNPEQATASTTTVVRTATHKINNNNNSNVNNNNTTITSAPRWKMAGTNVTHQRNQLQISQPQIQQQRINCVSPAIAQVSGLRSTQQTLTQPTYQTTYRTLQPTEPRAPLIEKSNNNNSTSGTRWKVQPQQTAPQRNITVNINPADDQPYLISHKNWQPQQVHHRNGVELSYADIQGSSDSTIKVASTSKQQQQQQQQQPSMDDVIVVNGTHMSEEMSARILQSLSQKSLYHANNNASNGNNLHNSSGTNIVPMPTTHRNIQMTQSHRIQQTTSHRIVQPVQYKSTAQPARTYIEPTNKIGPEYFRVNTSDIQSTTSTFIDNIPLISARVDDSHLNTNDADDDIIGEEVRPLPIDSSMDARMRALHALLQDHTYAQKMAERQSQMLTVAATTSGIVTNAGGIHVKKIAHRIDEASKKSEEISPKKRTNSMSAGLISPTNNNILTTSAIAQKIKQSTTSQTIESVVAGAGGPHLTANRSILVQSTVNISPNSSLVQTKSPVQSISQPQQQQPQIPIPTPTPTPTITPTSTQLNVMAPLIPGYRFPYNVSMNNDDDANSAISNGSRNNKSDLDQGEETETAPEAGNEDDSITRCICDLSHDDGYMICCDKCSVWQHVDCMGIDRQNIPEEYKCELCQPRPIDQNRARTLQLMKRKEQQNFLLMKQSQPVSGIPIDSSASPVSNTGERTQLNAFSTIVANKKKGTLTAKSRKNDLFGAGSSSISKRKRSDSTRGSNNKRREQKKSLSSKRKSASNSNTTTPVKQATTPTDNSNDKQSSNLRQWIENYEIAMTNHYSPELRARLHSISKQSPSNALTSNPLLKNANTMENKCTTVPHAGAKILISTREIAPNNPVIEIRGKYMLSTQYKPQQQINLQSSANGTRNFSKMNPGPFMFFHRLQNDGPEICVDTRTYGNEARFVRRSCRPNAEIVHTIEKGIPHLYIVSLNTIRSSTEITIKHEAHDLESLARGEITAPTSTLCGCGLIKDCIFGALTSQNPMQVATVAATVAATATSTTPNSSKKSTPKRPNGHVKDKKKSAQRLDSEGSKQFDAVSKRSQHRKKLDKLKRNSTSGSDSNLGMLSPSKSPSKQSLSYDDPYDSATNENVSILHHLGLERVQPPPNPLDQLPNNNDESVRKNNNSIESPSSQLWPETKKNEQTNQVPASIPATPITTPSIPTTTTTTIKDMIDVEQTPTSPLNENRTIKSPPSTPISIPNLKSPSNKSMSHKKITRKSTCSFSEDTGDEYSVSHSSASGSMSATKKHKEPKKAIENKKLTREERKMEAIVRAFEKMEKTEQRKNEQNKHKSIGPTNVHSGSLSKKQRSSSLYSKDKNDSLKKSSSQQGRRKRKRGKSYSQPINQKRRRNRMDSHNSDDGNTTDESSTPMMSPKSIDRSHLDRQKTLSQRETIDNNTNQNDNNLAAGLLLSLSNYGLTKNVDKTNCITSPDNPYNASKSLSSTPPFSVSSACLLIEAAVGPLDNDFKLPTKAKTKKSIMNEWLHQSDGTSSYSPQNHEASSSMDICSHDSNVPAAYNDEPQNLSIAAQKIEEFINLSSKEQSEKMGFWLDEDGTKGISKGKSLNFDLESGSHNYKSADSMATTPTPPLQMGSSVKKRWLRQAISEECSDDILASSSATSSPPNGFMAPLKKRRVIRQVTDINTEDNMPSPREDTKDSIIDDDIKGWRSSEYTDDVNVTIKTESETKEEDEDTQISVPNVQMKMVEKLDLNKFEPIESDEDEQFTSESIDIKMELDDSQDRSMSDIKDEDISQDAKQTANECDKPLTSEHKSSIEKTEMKDETPSESDKKEKKEGKFAAIATVLPKDEIEDIQQKLHSFHSENLMILQTRNKKRASRATTPTSMDEFGSSSSTPSNTKESSCSSDYSGKSRKFSTDERDYKREPSFNKLQNEDNIMAPIATIPPPTLANAINSTTSGTHPYSSYLINITHRNDGTQPIFPSTNVLPPGFANVHPQLAANASNSLYHYLENPNRSGFNTPNFNANTSPMIDPAKNTMRPHLFSMHTNVTPPTLLNSSSYLTKSYSTLSEPSSVHTSPVTPITPSPNTTPLNPKVLTRTQSADPRLNPQKDLPPVTPKRKLSINEYRKRKQLSVNSDKSKPEETEKSENSCDSMKATNSDETPKTETKETVFSPAPTLLELQQESLSRRLKSYKSLHGLTSQTDLPKSTETLVENDITSSISEVPDVSSSSSLTSVSSPKSEDFDIEANDNELLVPETEPVDDETIRDIENPRSPSPNPEPIEDSFAIEQPTSCRASAILSEPENEFDLEPANPLENSIPDSSGTSFSDAI